MSKQTCCVILDIWIAVGWLGAVVLLVVSGVYHFNRPLPAALASSVSPSIPPPFHPSTPRYPAVSPTGESSTPACDYASVADGHPWKRLLKQQLAVRVFVGHGWKDHAGYELAALSGFEEWVTASKGRVKFVLVGKRSQADITLRLLYGSKDGYTRIATWGPYMKRGEITLGTLTLSNHVISLVNFKADAAHEFGHALGILNHSPYPADLMYPIMEHQTQITSRDLATLNKIYGWTSSE